jgi:hypothetical protein
MGRDSHAALQAMQMMTLNLHTGRCKEILFNTKMRFETYVGIGVLYAKCR